MYVTAAVQSFCVFLRVFVGVFCVFFFVFAPSGVFLRVSGTAPAGGVVPVTGTTQ